MINRQQLLKDLQGLLPKLEKDILAYSESRSDLTAHLRDEYDKTVAAGRTAEHFLGWREAQITQAAVAWVLTCVFVRFLEDNGLLAEPMIAGPVEADGKKPLQDAKERMTAYFNDHPTHAEREYLLNLFEQLEKLPVMAELLDHRHNPLWQIQVSADGAKLLIDFFQRINAGSGEILHDFTDASWDTRFLGDLYQDLSESVRKRYALLQTPEFVESFILDYTLEKAKETFGLPGLRLVDPTCGSGHFLLTTFERIFDYWVKREPGTNTRVLAQRALDVVHGVDINPYAIAICKFRLLIAAMKVSGCRKIKDAPDFHFNLACGDSLLHGPRFEWQGQGAQPDMLGDDPIRHVLEVEDKEKLLRILGQQYHVVVGNPPYISVKDRALSDAYREKYPTCYRQYSLGVPFTERFFDLTLSSKGNQPPGYMGMITANSFMKREFGKKLIEAYLPKKDLTHVIDTSGAYIPGHGTPTVILLARNQQPRIETVRAVMGIRGEPGTPDDAALGKVWQSILSLLPKPGSENEFVSVVDHARSLFSSHPWSIGGGGATDLKELVDSRAVKVLDDLSLAIGFVCITKQDDVFVQNMDTLSRFGVGGEEKRAFGIGEEVRDWSHSSNLEVIFPYNNDLSTRNPAQFSTAIKFMWPCREILYSRKVFSGQTYREAGKPWYEFGQIPVERFKIPLSITFAFVATHNHFVLDRGGKVFSRSAPVIKLPIDATETDHLSLLGLLNSSTACFWMKQVFHNKGSTVDVKGARQATIAFENFYEFTGTGLKDFPIPADPAEAAKEYAKILDKLSLQLQELEPINVIQKTVEHIQSCLHEAKAKELAIVHRSVALQEELDWCVYQLYGITDENLCYPTQPPEVDLGQRAFEINLARRMQADEAESTWFTRHNSTPTTEIPAHWPDDYRTLIMRRLEVINSNPWIKLIEQPEFKRRWNRESWEHRTHKALQDWLLGELEQLTKHTELQTCAQLADRARRHIKLQEVSAIYCGTNTFDLQNLVAELVSTDNVPQMAAACYKPYAMPKFRAWQETWAKQRREDAIDAEFSVDKPIPADKASDPEAMRQYQLAKGKADAKKAYEIGHIPVPPQYASSDYRQPSYWPLRGKLDVPKERFFSLPGCEKDGDSTLVIGWAGLNYLQRAQAIAAWYIARKEEDGWESHQLKPMLVALDELTPWLKQWHNDIDPEYGARMGDYYESFLLEELRQLNVARDELLRWEPAATQASRGRRKKSVAE